MKRFFCWLIPLTVLFLSPQVLGKSLPPAPCGVLQQSEGEVFLLNANRSSEVSLQAHVATAIPCGGWLLVKSGWAQISYPNGSLVQVGPHSLIQLRFHFVQPRTNLGKKGKMHQDDGDALVLFRGVVYLKVGSGQEEMSVITAGSRVRVPKGQALILENPELGSVGKGTQAISLQNEIFLENRFVPQSHVSLQTGESSVLDWKGDEPSPTLPEKVSLVAVKPYLSQLRLSEAERVDLLRRMLQAQEVNAMGFNTELGMEAAPLDSSEQRPDYGTFKRAKGTELANADLKRRFIQKVTGEASHQESLIHPQNQVTDRPWVKVSVEKVQPKQGALFQNEVEDPSQLDPHEKKALLDSLSKIQFEGDEAF